MARSYYIYELIDPRTGRVFYIGKGSGNRMHQHDVNAYKAHEPNDRKNSTIRSIHSSGLAVKKRIVANFSDEQEAYDFEAAAVERTGLENLTNMIPGGGTPCSGPTVERDREIVRACAEIINRTMDGKIDAVLVDGKPFNLLPIIEDYKNRAYAVLRRRGMEWVNAIMEPFGVQFLGTT